MNAKTTMVTLKAIDSGRSIDLEIGHATRLLNWPGSMWELDDNNFKFEDNEIKRRCDKERGKKAEQKGADNAGSGAARED